MQVKSLLEEMEEFGKKFESAGHIVKTISEERSELNDEEKKILLTLDKIEHEDAQDE